MQRPKTQRLLMPDLSTWTVLVVDDESENINVVQLVLEFNDITVLTATSGMQCLEILERQQPTLFLIDIQMPEMSGIELLDRIRARWPGIPAIAMTAYTMQGDRERMLAAGFDGYIGKPINVMTLVDDITAMMDSRKP